MESPEICTIVLYRLLLMHHKADGMGMVKPENGDNPEIDDNKSFFNPKKSIGTSGWRIVEKPPRDR
jgi:hypothetical protein